MDLSWRSTRKISITAIITVSILLTIRMVGYMRGAVALGDRHLCMRNAGLINRALLLYCEDWDDTFPYKERWDSSLGEKQRRTHLPRNTWVCPSNRSVIGYAVNRDLLGLACQRVSRFDATISVFESDQSYTGAAARTSELPDRPRHGSLDISAFLDGSIKVLVRPGS